MLVVLVSVQVIPESIADFLAASVVNAVSSRAEPGILRFDVLQDQTTPELVTLVEVYRDAAAAAAHKDTAHYATWRDTVADMMAAPRTSRKFTPVDPVEASAWSANG